MQSSADFLRRLEEEHAVIERVLGSMWSCARGGGGITDDGKTFVRFFKTYAGRFHHAREEDILFNVLAQDTDVPRDHGPLRVLVDDHHAMGKLLDAMEVSTDAAQVATLVERYGNALLHHIDAENSVLYPEAAQRFKRAGIRELPEPPPDAEAARAREDAERLVAVYPAQEFPGLFRGEGCVACDAYGTRCDGLERELWSDHEWEDFFARNS